MGLSCIANNSAHWWPHPLPQRAPPSPDPSQLPPTHVVPSTLDFLPGFAAQSVTLTLTDAADSAVAAGQGGHWLRGVGPAFPRRSSVCGCAVTIAVSTARAQSAESQLAP